MPANPVFQPSSRAALIATFFLLLAPAGAQTTATLTGTVLDPAGSPIPGARLRALPGDGRPSLPAVLTGSNGDYSLDLSTGFFTVFVAAPGFRELSQTVVLTAPGSTSRDFVLQLDTVRETVTVADSADYRLSAISSATRTLTPLRDVPQSVTVIPQNQIQDQMMMSVGDVARYVPGITAIQGENNRDQLVIRGNSTSADFFLNGVRDDVQYYRDLYNLDRVEALKGPNAMIFGRGGGGGVLNRVTKEAGPASLREISLLGGSQGNRRVAIDWNQPLTGKLAFRLNGLYENSGSYRRFVDLERRGINPTLTFTPGSHTRIVVAYENFRDDRVADRGIPSFQGRPADVDISTYYGNPSESHAGARIHLGSASIEHDFGSFTLRNRTLIGDYDRGYQNFVPGAVNSVRTQVSLSAYNNATRRRNSFNQTDLTFTRFTGAIRHQLLAGVEAGLQLTNNFRTTGYFNNSATSVLLPFDNPVTSMPITFRQSATDAANHLQTVVAAAYLQDQIDLTRRLQLVTGLRFDRFDLRYHNNRTGENLRRRDHLLSPRAGLVFKPLPLLSVYGSYGISYLPSSGDQFSSLTTITQQAKPEKFANYELGLKWDLTRNFSLTTAVYRLDRTNTRATDPNDPTRLLQTGSQRTNGYELGWNGSITSRWNITGGYAWQDGFITTDTTAARARAQVAQVPHHTISLWNQYRLNQRWGGGLGILGRSAMFAAIDNTVRLPGYVRADAAVYYALTERTRLQVNVENLAGARYYINADGNNNISPGSGRLLRAGLIVRF